MQDPTGIVKGSMSKCCFEGKKSLAKGVPIALENCAIIRLHANAAYLCIVPACIAAVYQATPSTMTLPSSTNCHPAGGSLHQRQGLLQRLSNRAPHTYESHHNPLVPFSQRNLSHVDSPSSRVPSAPGTQGTDIPRPSVDLDVELGDQDSLPPAAHRAAVEHTPPLQPSCMREQVAMCAATPSLDCPDMSTSQGGALASTLPNESSGITSGAAGPSFSRAGCVNLAPRRPLFGNSRGACTLPAQSTAHPPSLASVLLFHENDGGNPRSVRPSSLQVSGSPGVLHQYETEECMHTARSDADGPSEIHFRNHSRYPSSLPTVDPSTGSGHATTRHLNPVPALPSIGNVHGTSGILHPDPVMRAVSKPPGVPL
jgi:hypothetical protein